MSENANDAAPATPPVEAAPAATPAVESAAPATEAKVETPAAPAEAPAVDPKTVVPETADGYTLPVPEGDDGVFAKTAAAWFHEAGIPPVQAEKLATKWNEFAAAQQAAAAESEKALEAQAEAKFKTEDSALRKEWGDKYDANVELGKRAYREFGFTEEVVNAVEDKVGPAQLLKIFASIGQKIGEDTSVGLGSGSNTLTMATAAEKLYGKTS